MSAAERTRLLAAVILGAPSQIVSATLVCAYARAREGREG